jgi:hypothetical protein
MDKSFKYGCSKCPKEGVKDVVQTTPIYMGPRIVKLKNKV